MRRRVRIKKGQLDYFRRLAKKTDNEIQAYLVGKIVSPELVVIEYLAYTKQYHTQTPDNVRWYQVDVDDLKKKAEEDGFVILGDIHSHPNYWPVLSELDHKNHIVEGKRITGICATMCKKSVVYFWFSDSSLPCEIEYVEETKH